MKAYHTLSFVLCHLLKKKYEYLVISVNTFVLMNEFSTLPLWNVTWHGPALPLILERIP